MNILLEKLPESVEIDGCNYTVNTDFRNCLRIILAFEDPDLAMVEKQYVMLQLLYPEIPFDTSAATEKAVWFLNCGKVGEDENGRQQPRVYSFEHDAQYIYAAIRQTHGIDLETASLHWWKFVYLFMDIKEDCFFSKLVDLRSRRARGKLSKEEKEYCNRIANIVDLPRIESEEEASAVSDFLAKLGKS